VSEIILVRRHDIQVTEQDKEAARRVLFGHIDGLGDKAQKSWRRLFNRLFKLEAGECIEIKTHQERIGWWHRKHMALEQNLFESQEVFQEFEQFRNWLKIGAGFVDWHVGPKGGVVPIPKSIRFSKLEQSEMEEVHNNMIDFLRTAHAQKVLWRHLDEAKRVEFLELILQGFGE